MTYEITLLKADIKGPMDGNMRLGLVHGGEQRAELEYSWDDSHFTAIFHGSASDLPIPAHPVALLQKPIAAIYDLKTDAHRFPSDVFQDHQVSIDVGE